MSWVYRKWNCENTLKKNIFFVFFLLPEKDFLKMGPRTSESRSFFFLVFFLKKEKWIWSAAPCSKWLRKHLLFKHSTYTHTSFRLIQQKLCAGRSYSNCTHERFRCVIPRTFYCQQIFVGSEHPAKPFYKNGWSFVCLYIRLTKDGRSRTKVTRGIECSIKTFFLNLICVPVLLRKKKNKINYSLPTIVLSSGTTSYTNKQNS